jgi:hypothetical protein
METSSVSDLFSVSGTSPTAATIQTATRPALTGGPELFAGHFVFYADKDGPLNGSFGSDWRSEVLLQDIALRIIRRGVRSLVEAAADSIAETGSYMLHVWVTPGEPTDSVRICDCHPRCERAREARALLAFPNGGLC